MEVYEFYGSAKGTAICLGDFDGAHLGHRRVFSAAAEVGDWGALLFTHNSKGEKEILTLSEKLEMLKKLGARYAIAADFEKELRDKSPEEFVEILKSFSVDTVVTGYDYRFGRGASGDTELLKRLCRGKNIAVITAEKNELDGEAVKSTKIRELIKNGEMERANILLGSPYIISGTVCKGLGNGRELGFPTANIEVCDEKLLPKDGVYKGLANGRLAVINIGKNPTFNAEKRTVEVHIIGTNENFYGKKVTAEILRRIRGEIKFRSQNELILQIKKDIENAEEEG
ncbi:MAG: riboflavin biosynthesis protein RibF [Clostridia bacterium]|nr:riboflavin biosynthesis protein RibF [Clostridia bacterium]